MNNECYRYSKTGTRITKLTPRCTHRSQTRYLTGVEIHAVDQSDNIAISVINGVRISSDGRVRYPAVDLTGSIAVELDADASLLSREGFYPFGGTAWWAKENQTAEREKPCRYSGKERDNTGLYYYGFRYYAAWLMRWLNTDPAGVVDGLNIYRMSINNPLTMYDRDGGMAFPAKGKIITSIIGSRHILQQQLENKNSYGIPETEEYLERDPLSSAREKNVAIMLKHTHKRRHNTMYAEDIRPEPKRYTKFVNKFKPYQWSALEIVRARDNHDYFTSDVIVHQYTKISKDVGFYGFFPSIIKHEYVVNDETLNALDKIENEDNVSNIFLTKTPNGKCVQRVLNRIGFRAINTVVVNYLCKRTDIYVLIEPDPVIHPNFTVRSAPKPASSLAC